MMLLSGCLNNLLSPMMKDRKIYHGKIFLDWPDIVGHRVAQFSWPQKIIKDKAGENLATLYIEVYNSSFATELQYLEDHLIEKISLYFGYKVVSKIKTKIKTDNQLQRIPVKRNMLSKKQQEELDIKLNFIEEDSLKHALKSLSTVILTNMNH